MKLPKEPKKEFYNEDDLVKVVQRCPSCGSLSLTREGRRIKCRNCGYEEIIGIE